MIAHIRWIAVSVLVAALLTPMALAGDPIDLDLWHQELIDTLGEEPEQEADRRPAFGIYPTLGAALGAPGLISAQGHAYLSFTDGKTFSIFAGCGVEWGPKIDSTVITVGWGGVRPIPVASKQTGFHGKFLRYRRWEHEDHGVHYGISVGTESGVGFGALAFEIGAARSDRNHWLIVAQVQLKVAAPIRIPLTRRKAQTNKDDPSEKMRNEKRGMPPTTPTAPGSVGAGGNS